MRRVSGEKEGTRPAGMWEVTPPAHVAAMREQRGGGGRGGVMMGKGGKGKGEGSRPAYLRGVQSKIGPQVDAHKERLRKVWCIVGALVGIEEVVVIVVVVLVVVVVVVVRSG